MVTVTRTASIWAPPESFVDTLPAVLADAPPLPGDLQRAPHFPPDPINGEISAGMAYPTTLALIAALWSGPGRYSRGLSASGAASPACIGCRCCPRLTASTMILAPRPTITMPAII
jgi:hypothetical protein